MNNKFKKLLLSALMMTFTMQQSISMENSPQEEIGKNQQNIKTLNDYLPLLLREENKNAIGFGAVKSLVGFIKNMNWKNTQTIFSKENIDKTTLTIDRITSQLKYIAQYAEINATDISGVMHFMNLERSANIIKAISMCIELIREPDYFTNILMNNQQIDLSNIINRIIKLNTIVSINAKTANKSKKIELIKSAYTPIEPYNNTHTEPSTEFDDSFINHIINMYSQIIKMVSREKARATNDFMKNDLIKIIQNSCLSCNNRSLLMEHQITMTKLLLSADTQLGIEQQKTLQSSPENAAKAEEELENKLKKEKIEAKEAEDLAEKKEKKQKKDAKALEKEQKKQGIINEYNNFMNQLTHYQEKSIALNPKGNNQSQKQKEVRKTNQDNLNSCKKSIKQMEKNHPFLLPKQDQSVSTKRKNTTKNTTSGRKQF